MIVSYFYKENNQAAVLVYEHSYTMLQTYLALELWRLSQKVRNVQFQQDGAVAYMARHDKAWLLLG